MSSEFDVRSYNRDAWDRNVKIGNRWTIPVNPQVIAAARQGEWALYLTPTIPVPVDWYPRIQNAKILCLASGGGQQAPVLAAAGADVTVFDNSPGQLAQDRMEAEREGLELEILEGDMADLSILQDESFDLIFHPVSNVFIPHVSPVWMEAFRVLKPGGELLAGITNPVIYLFDYQLLDEHGIIKVKYTLPYSDLEQLPAEELDVRMSDGDPMEYSHSLDEQIGGQLEAGFVLSGFYEDKFEEDYILNDYLPGFFATRATKPVK